MQQAQTLIDLAHANLALYTRQLMQARNALTFLIGAPLPADLPTGNVFSDENVLTAIPEGLPSDLLERRPDIRAAEHQLLAANANIGAARAAFFPSISLTGNFGTASTHLNGLFQDGSQAWVFNPQINLPIFAGGANMANLDLAHVEKMSRLPNTRKPSRPPSAKSPTRSPDARRWTTRWPRNNRWSTPAATHYRLSDMRFRGGVDSYLTVIISQRTLYAAEQDLIVTKLTRLTNLVTLYKALGGGWTDASKTPVPAAHRPRRHRATSRFRPGRFPSRDHDVVGYRFIGNGFALKSIPFPLIRYTCESVSPSIGWVARRRRSGRCLPTLRAAILVAHLLLAGGQPGRWALLRLKRAT